MILICEPQCIGFEHAEINAALLTAFQYAFPNNKIVFLAESCHQHEVKTILKLNSITGMRFVEIEVPPRNSNSMQRLPFEIKLCENLFGLALKNKIVKVIFASITGPGLIAIKMKLFRYKDVVPIVIPHGILETIIKRPSLRPTEIFFWFRIAFIIGSNSRIKYLLLGQAIKDKLIKMYPKLSDQLYAIDIPYFYRMPAKYTVKQNQPVKFGSFGTGRKGKGTELFFQLAQHFIQSEFKAKAEFMLIGHIDDKSLRSLKPDRLIIASLYKPMDRSDFDIWARNIHYAVFCYDARSYSLSTSGSFFDALSYVKPIIALRNPCFEYYFNQMGDIGYLCKNYNEMKKVITDILDNPDTKKYNDQVGNILTGRDNLSLVEISRKLALL